MRCRLTTDRGKLAEAIDAAQDDPTQFEAWPSLLSIRQHECARDRSLCPSYAVDEYFHSVRQIKAFRAFLETLGETAGRKTVVYFNQNGVLHPGGFYGQDDRK